MNTKNKRFWIVKDSNRGYAVRIERRFLFWFYWKQLRIYGRIYSFKTDDEARGWISQGCPPLKNQ